MKQFLYKIYEPDGTFIRTLPIKIPVSPTTSDELVLNTPTITRSINGGGGELIINLDTKFDDFDEGVSIKNGNLLKLYVVSDDQPKGKILFNGIIQSYRPYLRSSSEGVNIIVLSKVTELQQDFYRSAGSRTFTKSSIKASDLFKDIIDEFQSVYTNSDIAYTVGSVEDSGVVITYSFDNDTSFEAIEASRNVAPAGWWWRIEPDGTATFKSKPASATYTLVSGVYSDIAEVELDKSMEDIKNNLLLKWSGGTTQFQDATSRTNYGTRSILIDKSAEITTTGTRDYWGNAYISENKDYKNRVYSPIIINNSFEYIEDILPGDTIKVLGFKKGQSPFVDNMQIVKTVYNGTIMKLTLSKDNLNFAEQIRLA